MAKRNIAPFSTTVSQILTVFDHQVFKSYAQTILYLSIIIYILCKHTLLHQNVPSSHFFQMIVPQHQQYLASKNGGK